MSMTEVVELIQATPAKSVPKEDIFVLISNGNEQGVQEMIAADNTIVHAKGPVS